MGETVPTEAGVPGMATGCPGADPARASQGGWEANRGGRSEAHTLAKATRPLRARLSLSPLTADQPTNRLSVVRAGEVPSSCIVGFE